MYEYGMNVKIKTIRRESVSERQKAVNEFLQETDGELIPPICFETENMTGFHNYYAHITYIPHDDSKVFACGMASVYNPLWRDEEKVSYGDN